LSGGATLPAEAAAAVAAVDTRLFIGGEFVEARSGERFEVPSPRDGELLARVSEAREEDVDLAVAAAAAAAAEWRATGAEQRGRLLARLADLIEAHERELALIEAADAGHAIRDTTELDVPRASGIMRYFAGAADKLEGTVATPSPGLVNYVTYEPIGVVGQIVPWNLPLMFAAWKLAPALATGNTVVLKPAELTPLSTLRLAALAAEAGIPPGVVNVVPGYGAVAGARLAEHPDVRKIAFTGSTAVGRSVVEASAGNVKRVQLELGGKGPNIVFDDADLDQAVDEAINAAFHNQGQACIAGSRILAQSGVLAELTERIAAVASRLVVGDPLDPGTEIGPVISGQHRERVLDHLRRAEAEGVATIAEAQLPTDPSLAGGYYLAPRVLSAEASAAICREEVFGPVVTVTGFEHEDEAVEIANSLEYGLGAGLWTADIDRAHRVSAALEAGMVWINTYKHVSPAAPFGGVKQSGYGREMGLQGMREYCVQKSVWIDYGSGRPARYGKESDDGS
jgi:aldehyde dehydrogenase (NAD+)/betaine-aldehyde dehydrogenase